MSELVRFKTGPEGKQEYLKARIYERCSRKLPCACCGTTKIRVMLIRFSEPIKKDFGICHECILLMAFGRTIIIDKKADIRYGRFSPREIISSAPIRAPKKSGSKDTGKIPCPICKELMGKGAGMRLHMSSKHPKPTENKETKETPKETDDKESDKGNDQKTSE